MGRLKGHASGPVAKLHQVEDIEVVSFGARVVRCRCGYRTAPWSTPEKAVAEHDAHRVEALAPALGSVRTRKWRAS